MIDFRKGKIVILFSLSLLFIFSSLSYAQTTHFFPCYGEQNPFQPMTIFVFEAKFNGQDFEAGDEIAVYDGEDCVGAEVLTDVLSPSNFLPILASKYEESIGCGFTDGNEILFKAWDSSEDQEFTLTAAEIQFYDPATGEEIEPVLYQSMVTALVGLNIVMPYLTVSPLNQDVSSAAGQTAAFTVTSNIAWSATESEDWLSVTAPGSGDGDGTFTVDYDANASTSSRVGTITVSGDGLTQDVTVTQAGEDAILTVAPLNQDVSSAAGQTAAFTVTSNIAWSATESEDWLSVTAPGSGDGDGTFTVDYDANASTSSRVGTITVSGDGLTQDVTVTQAGEDAILTVAPLNQDVSSAAGQTAAFTVTSNIAWSATESEDWLSVTAPGSGDGDGTFTVDYDANASTSSRVGTITVSGDGLTQDVTVTQAGEDAILTVAPLNQDVSSAAGQTAAFTVTSNIAWSATESEDWLSVTAPGSGDGDGTFTVDYDANASTSSRVGTITVSGDGLTQDVTVTQAGEDAILTVAPLNQDVSSAAGQTAAFTVTSNIAWSATESEDWLSVTAPGSGDGDGTFTVDYDANASTSSRVGTITVSGDGLTQDVTVTQAGEAAILTVAPLNQDVSSAAGQTAAFTVTSNIAWSATESEDWLSVTAPGSGDGDGTFTVDYDANASTSSRVGTITVSGDGLTQDVTVTQAGEDAILTVAPLNQDVSSAAGQTAAFTVTSNIAWSATESEDWLSVTAPGSGDGDGTFTVDYDANASTSSRIGTITVSGDGLTQDVTVTQAGEDAILTVAPLNQDVSSAAGQTAAFTVTSNISWSATESEDWLSVTAPGSGDGDGTFTVDYDANASTVPRIGTITVSGDGLTQDVTVTQAGEDAILTVAPLNQDVSSAAGQTAAFTVTSNIAWSATESEDWLSVTAPGSGDGDGTFTVDYDANASTSSRIGTITVSGDGLTQDVTVTQAGEAAILTVAPLNQDVSSAAGQTAAFTVTSNIAWSAAESEDWLSVTAPGSGDGDGTFTVDYDANASTSSRIGTITVSGDGLTQDVTVTQAGEDAILTVAPLNQDVSSAAGQTAAFTVTSNIAWSATESEDWLSVTAPGSGDGDGTFTVDYDANASTSSRIGTITVSGDGLTQDVTVTQAGEDAILTVAPLNQDVSSAAGQTAAFTVTSNIAWSATESEDWLSVTAPGSGDGDGTFTVDYDANASTSSRVGTITVSGDGLTQDVTVTQAGEDAILTVAPLNQDVSSAAGQTAAFTVTSNIAWSATESEDWLSVTAPGSGDGDGTFTVDYDANASTSSRVGTITVSGDGLTQDVTVTQAGEDAILTVAPLNQDVSSAAGQTAAFTVTSNIAWSATESEDWLSVTAPGSGDGDGTFTVDYDANASTSSRVGTITVSGDGLTQDVTVTQAGEDAILTVAPLNQDVSSAAGQTAAFTVTSNIAWSATESEDWLSVTAPGSGDGDGTFTVDYDANASTSSRVGTITVSGDGLTQDVTVTQAGEAAILTVAPLNQDVSSAAGQTAAFTVTSNIAWSATESEDWLSVTAPGSGDGDGTFTVDYDANASTSSRVGTITVSGDGLTQDVTVTQAGEDAILTVAPLNQDVSSAAGQTAAFTVTSNIAWSATESEDWLSVTAPGSGDGDGTFTVDYDANASTSSRIGTITVSGDGLTQDVTVTQAGEDAILTVAPLNQDVSSAAGQTAAFTVTSNIAWSATESEDWLSVTAPGSGDGDGTFTVDYDANASTVPRIGTITVSGDGLTQDVTVTQAGEDAILTVAPLNQDVSSAAGQTAAFTVTSNIAWSATESEDWLSVTAPGSGDGDGTFTVDYDANASTSSRIGTITVSGDGLTQDVTVTQAGEAAILTVAPLNQDVSSAAGQTAAFTVTSNIAWSAAESEDWLSVTAPGSGDGDGTFTVDYDANASTSSRIGTITVSGDGLTQDVTVTQAGTNTYLTVEPENQDVSAEAGKTTFDVKSNISWTVGENEKWLSVTPANGNGDGTLTVEYDKNRSVDKRVGKITLSGDGLTVDATVTQAGATAYLTVEPKNQDVGPEAGTTKFDVKSNVNWEVSEKEDWLSVVSPKCTKDGEIVVIYEENTSIDQRIGKLTVSGGGLTVEVTVTQAGTAAYLTVEPENQDVSAEAGKTTFDVKSNISWTVGENEKWLSVTPTDGKGDGTLTIAYEKNGSADKRIGKITLSGAGLTVDLTVNQAGAKAYLTVEPTNRDVGPEAGTTRFDVKSNVSWEVSEKEDWLSVVIPKCTKDGEIVLIYEENPSIDQRIGKLTVSGGGLTVEITVTQAGENVYLTAEPANRDVDHKEGTTTFDIKSNISWTVSENEKWLSVAPADGKGDGTLTIAYEKNGSVDKRIGKITLSGAGLIVDLTVTQAGTNAYLTVEPGNRDVGAEAGKTTFDVKSNISWTFSENEEWLSVTPANGKCDVTFIVEYDKNDSLHQRIGKITLTGAGLTVDVTVTQAGVNAYLTAEPEKRDVDHESGKTTFIVKSNVDWIATESLDWLSVSPANGNGDGTLTVDYDENSEKECRTGHIIINGNGIETSLTVRQKGVPCLAVTPPICSIGSESSDTTLTIQSNLEWTVEVSESWVFVTPMSGSGDENLSLHFEDYTDLEPRTAIIKIMSGDFNVEVEVNQSSVTSLANDMNQLPTEYQLDQNYPNPFNPSTTIGFTLPKESNVTLEVYNASGQMIKTLINAKLSRGYHSVVWEAGHLSSGVYFCRLKTNEFQDIVKMILAK